jgi:predicted anti-sigma-YlaC factor YlaD
MKCDKVKIYIAENLGDSFSKEPPEEIKQHLETCDTCQAYFDFIKETQHSFINENEEIKSNPFLYTKLQSRMADTKTHKKSMIRKAVLRPVFAGLIIIASISFGVFIGNNNSFLYGSITTTEDSSEENYYTYFGIYDHFESTYLNIIEDDK